MYIGYSTLYYEEYKIGIKVVSCMSLRYAMVKKGVKEE